MFIVAWVTKNMDGSLATNPSVFCTVRTFAEAKTKAEQVWASSPGSRGRYIVSIFEMIVKTEPETLSPIIATWAVPSARERLIYPRF